MSTASEQFMKGIHSVINQEIERFIDVINSQKDYDSQTLIGLSINDIQTIKTIKLSPTQLISLRKLILLMVRTVIFGIFCIIDGVSYASEDAPPLAIINRETGKDISDEFLHDEFLRDSHY